MIIKKGITMKSINILLLGQAITEDPKLIRYLNSSGLACHTSFTTEEAFLLLEKIHICLLIIDWKVGIQTGLENAYQLRQAGYRQPILTLIPQENHDAGIKALLNGVDVYLPQPFDRQELLARIRALLRRAYGVLSTPHKSRIKIKELDIDLESQRVYLGKQPVHLTSIEFRLLAFLAQQPGHTFSREYLIEELWGYKDFYGDIRTIDVHVRNLRIKIEADPGNPVYVVTVRGAGYKCATSPLLSTVKSIQGEWPAQRLRFGSGRPAYP